MFKITVKEEYLDHQGRVISKSQWEKLLKEELEEAVNSENNGPWKRYKSGFTPRLRSIKIQSSGSNEPSGSI